MRRLRLPSNHDASISLSIWSQPWGAKAGWKRYLRRYGAAGPRSSVNDVQSVSFAPSLGRNHVSVVLLFSF